MKKYEETNITEIEMLDSIKRSGYLLEAEITKKLAGEGYFVESNVAVLDPITNKSREIDLIAGFFDMGNERTYNNLSASFEFVFEIKNNSFPLVLLNQLEWSPSVIVAEGLKDIITKPDKVEFNGFDQVSPDLIEDEKNIYTQYCSFQRKKTKDKEIMAVHPENLYSGLLKISQYCDQSIDEWGMDNDMPRVYEGLNIFEDKVLRYFLNIPILLINTNLYELVSNYDEFYLKKVEISNLLYNYHFKGEQKMSLIYVMTRKGLDYFLPKMRNLEKSMEKKMSELLKNNE